MTAEHRNSVCSGDGALDLVLDCAALLHANGQSTDMTVTAVGRLNDGLGASSTLVPSWVTVMLVDQGPQAGISCAPATPSSINMRRVSAAMRVIDRAEDGPLDEGQVRSGLAAAATERSSSLAEFALACATGAAALAVIFGETAPVVVAIIAARILTPYATTTWRSMAVCFSPTSTLTPRPALACPPGTRSRTAPMLRVNPPPNALIPGTSRAAIPAIFSTTPSAMVVRPRLAGGS